MVVAVDTLSGCAVVEAQFVEVPTAPLDAVNPVLVLAKLDAIFAGLMSICHCKYIFRIKNAFDFATRKDAFCNLLHLPGGTMY